MRNILPTYTSGADTAYYEMGLKYHKTLHNFLYKVTLENWGILMPNLYEFLRGFYLQIDTVKSFK